MYEHSNDLKIHTKRKWDKGLTLSIAGSPFRSCFRDLRDHHRHTSTHPPHILLCMLLMTPFQTHTRIIPFLFKQAQFAWNNVGAYGGGGLASGQEHGSWLWLRRVGSQTASPPASLILRLPMAAISSISITQEQTLVMEKIMQSV